MKKNDSVLIYVLRILNQKWNETWFRTEKGLRLKVEIDLQLPLSHRKTCEPLLYLGHCALYSFSVIAVSFNISKFLVETVSVIQRTMTESK